MQFESLDFVYNPSRDVKRDVAYFTELAAPPRLFLLADHVEGIRRSSFTGSPTFARH